MLSPLTGGNDMLAGILISLAAGTVAAVMLWQLAVAQGLGPRLAATAVALLGVAPYGIFLAAVYSEALFLAVTVAAWWAAESPGAGGWPARWPPRPPPCGSTACSSSRPWR